MDLRPHAHFPAPPARLEVEAILWRADFTLVPGEIVHGDYMGPRDEGCRHRLHLPRLDAEEARPRLAGADFLRPISAKTADQVSGPVPGPMLAVVQFAPFGPPPAAGDQPSATVIRYGVGYGTTSTRPPPLPMA